MRLSRSVLTPAGERVLLIVVAAAVVVAWYCHG